MEENTPVVAQPQITPEPVENQPETTEMIVKTTHPLMKKIDTLMGMGVIGISLAGTLLAIALFGNLY